MNRRAALGVFCILVACGGPQKKPSSAMPVRPSAEAESGDVPDPSDRCTTIPTGCPGTEDEDGCPDVSLALGAQCDLAGRNADTLREVADEMKKQKRLTVLALVTSDRDCAEQAKKRLVDAGVFPTRLESRSTQPRGPGQYLYFEIIAWDGKRCDGR